MTDTYECTTCTDPDKPDEGPYEEFTFDITKRVKAARAAIALSREVADDFLEYFACESWTEDSARFMSLAYYAGEWPMVGKCPLEGDEGWYLFHPTENPDYFRGTNTWNTHNSVLINDANLQARLPPAWDGEVSPNIDPTNSYQGVGLGGLVGFISGEQRAGGDHPPVEAIEYTQTRSAVLVPIGQVFQTAEEDYLLKDRLARLIDSHVLDTFKAGDYVFINSPEPHGMMIVGFGPAVGPGGVTNYVQVSGSVTDEQGVSIGLTANAEDKKAELRTYAQGPEFLYHKRVPYVVDWNSGIDPGKRQRPRPFFHTRIIHDDVERFDHTYWLFVPAADSITVRCDYFLAKNIEGGHNADYFPRTNANGVYR